jgi:signal peptidase I
MPEAAPKPRRFAAPIVAFFIIGAGHVTVGRYRRSLGWLVANVIASFAIALAMTRSSPMLLLSAIAFFLLVRIASVVDVAFLPAADRAQLQGWGITILLWVALYGANFLTNLPIRAFLLEPFKIPAGSMSPTLIVGDHILVDKRARTPERGAVMVFRYPKEPDKDFVKRVIAVGGDTIEMRDGALFLNSRPIERHHVDGDCHYPDYENGEGDLMDRRCDAWEESLDGKPHSIVFDPDNNVAQRTWPPVTVPAGHFYVLGDNRDNSHDSRYWGFVPDENLKGRAISVFFSAAGSRTRWDRIGLPIR